MIQSAINDLLNGAVAVDSSITVNGWVRTRRDSKAGISFIQIHDGSCFATFQIVAPNSLENYESEILKLTSGCSIKATGKLVASQGRGQQFEMHAEAIVVVGMIDDPDTYPIQPKKHTLEFLREVAHLRPRTNTIGAATRVRHTVSQAIHKFFDNNGFYWVHTPIITASDCEGAGELFRVSTLQTNQQNFADDFFGKETFLTVSGQLNLETYCCALSKVYTFGPTFRAENSNTSRHLAEFWMVEPEIAFADLNDAATLAEDLLKTVCQNVLEQRADDLEFFAKHIDENCISRIESLINNNFERMEYTDAIKILEQAKQKFEFPVSWGHDLQSEHERYLAEKHVGKPVILMNYPKDIKGFYMRLNDDNKTVAAMDVLAPGIGEIIGGSQREERLNVLDKRLNESNLNPEDYQWYRDLRLYGTVPHAGFGLGLERFISYITGLSNVRDVIPFPRTPGSISY